MNDPFWEKAVEFLLTHTSKRDTVVLPDEMAGPPGTAIRYSSFNESCTFDFFVLHKGMFEFFSLPFMEWLVGTFSAYYANEVFVIFSHKPLSMNPDARHVEALYVKLEEARTQTERRGERAVFLHIPKTGGTSLYNAISKYYAKKIYFQRNEHLSGFRRNLEDYDLIAGHLARTALSRRLTQTRVWFLFLRHPVRRFLSAVAHSRRPNEDPSLFGPRMRLMRTLSLADLMRSDLGCREMHAQLYMLGSEGETTGGNEDLERIYDNAIAFLNREDVLVGITERMNESATLITNMLGLPDLEIKRKNVTGNYETLIPQSEISSVEDELHEAMQLDIKLYNQMAEILTKRMNASLPERSEKSLPGSSHLSKEAIFITGRFRSGTTVLWNLFNVQKRYTAYYEPLNDSLIAAVQCTKPMASHRGVSSYWDAYQPLLDQLPDYHKPEFAYHRLILEEGDKYRGLKNYLDFLLHQARDHRPVLQFNRVDFRLPWLRQTYPGATLVHVFRNPRNAWVSSRRHLPEDEWDDAYHPDAYDLFQWIVALGDEFPFVSDPKNSYEAHYYLYRLSRIMGERVADCSIDFDREIQSSPEASLSKLVETGCLRPDDVGTARTVIERIDEEHWSAYRSDKWFGEIESRCEEALRELGLLEGLARQPLASIKEQHRDAWNSLGPAYGRKLVNALLQTASAQRSTITRLLGTIREHEARFHKKDRAA